MFMGSTTPDAAVDDAITDTAGNLGTSADRGFTRTTTNDPSDDVYLDRAWPILLTGDISATAAVDTGLECWRQGIQDGMYSTKDRINSCPAGCKTTVTNVDNVQQCKFDENGLCPANCLYTRAIPYEATDAAIKADLETFMKNVTAAWKNRTTADSIEATRHRWKRGQLSTQTGLCEAALQNWARATDCTDRNKDFKEADRDLDTPASELAGCKYCAAPFVFNTWAGTGEDNARCLKAMYQRAKYDVNGCNVYGNQGSLNTCREHFKADTACTLDGKPSCTYCGDEGCPVPDDPDDDTNACKQSRKACKLFKAFQQKMPHTMCQFTDASCQQKLKEKTEDDLGVVGMIGGFFCLFFLIILYCTYRGVMVYMAGDDDDDDE